MNLAHLHLILNHVPTVGSAAALGLLILGYARRNQHLKHVGLEVLFIIAVLTVPVYITGVAAHRELRPIKEVSDDAIRVHQDAAIIGLTVMEIAGFAAWIALWQWRRHGAAARGMVPVATALLIASLAVMGAAANLGGEIRHPEIRADGEVAAAAGDPKRFIAYAITQAAVFSRWMWPAAEAVHFLGLSLSFGVLLAVNLRILGVGKRLPFTDVHRLLPWGMLGFGANLITGMFFFIGQPGQYIESDPFIWKIGFLMIAGANFLYLTVFGKAWRAGTDGFVANVGDKAMALLSLTAWLGVLYAGRMLPFLGKAF